MSPSASLAILILSSRMASVLVLSVSITPTKAGICSHSALLVLKVILHSLTFACLFTVTLTLTT